MSFFEYQEPVKLMFGKDSIKRLPEAVNSSGYKKGVLITSKYFSSSGIADDIVNSTKQIVGVFGSVSPNALLKEVTKASELIKETGADFVVAVGGGSTIDLAKFACSLAVHDGEAKEYFYKTKTFTSKRVPLIAVPTTSGTGSEVTSVSVCTDEDSGVKGPLVSNNFYPYLAIIDYMLTLSVPKYTTAISGLDALSHALEAFWNVNRLPITDMYAKKAVELIINNIEKAYDDGSNIEARKAMSLGSVYAGLAFAPTRTAAVHACSYALSNQYNLPHGEACAFTMGFFLQENADVDKRLNILAKDLGFKNVDSMVDKIENLKKKFALKTTLKDIGCVDVGKLVRECLAHPLFNNNPRKYTEESLTKAFKKYFKN